ncbi:MAG TPA: hypothetical protein P5136_00230 [Methanofastidiosum sp.]|nr:hypothetical protein [Methanofastidiosum sp.]
MAKKKKEYKAGHTFVGLNIPNELYDFIMKKAKEDFKNKSQVIIDIIVEKYHSENQLENNS